MVAAGHQTYERGDLLALTFPDADAEARWICDRIERLRGTAFQDAPSSEHRGLSWSDFAVLFRSVSKDAGPLVAELKRRTIPYVIKGLTRLFDAPEIQACVTAFQYVPGNAQADEVAAAWLAADIGLTEDDVSRGLDVLDRAKDWRGHRRQRHLRLDLGRVPADHQEVPRQRPAVVAEHAVLQRQHVRLPR